MKCFGCNEKAEFKYFELNGDFHLFCKDCKENEIIDMMKTKDEKKSKNELIHILNELEKLFEEIK